MPPSAASSRRLTGSVAKAMEPGEVRPPTRARRAGYQTTGRSYGRRQPLSAPSDPTGSARGLGRALPIPSGVLPRGWTLQVGSEGAPAEKALSTREAELAASGRPGAAGCRRGGAAIRSVGQRDRAFSDRSAPRAPPVVDDSGPPALLPALPRPARSPGFSRSALRLKAALLAPEPSRPLTDGAVMSADRGPAQLASGAGNAMVPELSVCRPWSCRRRRPSNGALRSPRFGTSPGTASVERWKIPHDA